MPDEGFLRRWSRRKIETRQGREPETEPAPAPEEPAASGLPAAAPALADGLAPHAHAHGQAGEGAGACANAAAPGQAPAREADAAEAIGLPTMDDVATLTRDSDYSSFVARGVDQAVRRSALKKLFADPHFNTMDRLDIYIDDYTKPSPVSETMLASLRHAARLFGRVADQTADDVADKVAVADALTADPAETVPPDPQDQQRVSDTASETPPETETR